MANYFQFVKITGIILTFSVLFSCVPARKYEELSEKRKTCEAENIQLKSRLQVLETTTNEQKALIEKVKKRIKALVADTTIMGNSMRLLRSTNKQVNDTYNLLLSKNKEILAGNQTETRKILQELKSAQEDLQKREDRLNKLEDELDLKKKGLVKLSKKLLASQEEMEKKELELNTLQKVLEEKEQKVNELETILSQKDSAVAALKKSVVDALYGFENKGLTIEQKNGKVYVSMEENLLFASGSYTISAKGVEALKKLSGVLETNEDINILVEGHTDDVPYKGAGVLKDNWDLSVMRATAIVKIIVKNSKIDPQRLTASGRSKFLPIKDAKSPEARAKNRRTEIILTPKLDELLKILETN